MQTNRLYVLLRGLAKWELEFVFRYCWLCFADANFFAHLDPRAAGGIAELVAVFDRLTPGGSMTQDANNTMQSVTANGVLVRTA